MLPLIDQALAARGWCPAMAPALWARYLAEQDAERRRHNRAMILLFTALFDIFILPEFSSEPDMVPLSSLLRLGIYTPSVLLFVALDFKQRLGRWHEPLLLCLALAPCVIAAILCARTVSVDALSNVRAMPLILLFTGLVLRIRLSTGIANAVLASAILVTGVLITPVVPPGEVSSLVITNLATAIAVVVFIHRLESRDRRVFLLNLNEQYRRALVVEQNRGLLREVQTDALTHVGSRRCFDETLSRLWLEAGRSGQPLALVMIDVDHFKAFNDRYGHQEGDYCLRSVAGRLCESARAHDVVARYGGEEFAAILPGASLAAAAAVAERMRAAVAAMELRPDRGGAAARVTVSIGVASAIPIGPYDARWVIALADRNLYAAKTGGRNRVEADPDAAAAEAAPKLVPAAGSELVD